MTQATCHAARGRRQARGERGSILALAAVFLGALVAVAAFSIEVIRLTHTATEVQVAADAAALAAAQNLISTGGSHATARDAGRTVAGRNAADGRDPAPDEVAIEFGGYTTASGFTLDDGNNAVRATVTLNNVRYLMASIFGLGSTTFVQRRAVATFVCTGNGRPTAPFTVGDCLLQPYSPGQACTANGITLKTSPDQSQNACWLANNSDDEEWLPPVTGCGTGTAPILSVGQSLKGVQTNGQMPPLYRDLRTCVERGVHEFVIPVIRCPISQCNGGVTVGTVIGFTTVRIDSTTDIVTNGPDAGIRLTQVCNNDAAGTGGSLGSSGAKCFGSGNVRLVSEEPAGT